MVIVVTLVHQLGWNFSEPERAEQKECKDGNREGGRCWRKVAGGRFVWEVSARHLGQGVISMSPVHHAPRAGPQILSHIQMLDACLIRIVLDKYMC